MRYKGPNEFNGRLIDKYSRIKRKPWMTPTNELKHFTVSTFMENYEKD